MDAIRLFIINYNKKALIALVLLIFVLLYPYTVSFGGVVLIDPYVKKRFAAVGILFLTLRGFVHDYYTSSWAIVFLFALILSATVPFGFIVLLTLAAFVLMRSMKKI